MRDWLATELREQAPRLPGGAEIAARFAAFQSDLPQICAAMRRTVGELTFTDYCEAVSEWLIDMEPAARGSIVPARTT